MSTGSTGANAVYAEDDLLPISALQHLLFCPRQCALIHVEQLWAENRLTVEGQHLHRKAHDGPHEARAGVRTVRSLALRSLRYGLIGKTDVVEFEPVTPLPAETPLPKLRVSARNGPLVGWRVTPIEYKRGKAKKDDSDRVQLCAQALCLEEMLGVSIAEGAIFYGQPRRRTAVKFDDALRCVTAEAAIALHRLFAASETPPAVYAKKCDNCSLISLCMPRMASSRCTSDYIASQFQQSLAATSPTDLAFDLDD